MPWGQRPMLAAQIHARPRYSALVVLGRKYAFSDPGINSRLGFLGELTNYLDIEKGIFKFSNIHYSNSKILVCCNESDKAD